MRAYQKAGWIATRSAGSHGEFDILAAWGPTLFQKVEEGFEPTVHLVECKLGGKISKKERELLVALAAKHGFLPVLAYEKDPIRRKRLDTGEEIDSLENPDKAVKESH